MALMNRPRFVAGSINLLLENPARLWTPVDASIGGRRVVASGIPASYLVRRDSLLELTVRLEEWEWPLFLDVVEYGQTDQPIRWFWDGANETDPDYDSVEVYLESPSVGERFSPTRDGQYPRLFEATITLRSLIPVTWPDYFPAD